MQDLYQMFGADVQKEKTGTEIIVGNDPKISFTVARAGGDNKRYNELLTKLLAPYRRQLDLGTLSESVSKKIMIEVFCRTCLLGWVGVKNKEAVDVPYNVDSAMALMEELPDLYNYLWGEAQKLSNYRDETGELAKN